jgi:hypothetical protein
MSTMSIGINSVSAPHTTIGSARQIPDIRADILLRRYRTALQLMSERYQEAIPYLQRTGEQFQNGSFPSDTLHERVTLQALFVTLTKLMIKGRSNSEKLNQLLRNLNDRDAHITLAELLIEEKVHLDKLQILLDKVDDASAQLFLAKMMIFGKDHTLALPLLRKRQKTQN